MSAIAVRISLVIEIADIEIEVLLTTIEANIASYAG
jgi:hypothetical protein